MRKPRILLSGKGNLENYINAINAAGAEAVAEYPAKIDTGYDGLLICGGCDIDPAYYGEDVDGAVDIDRERDENELKLLSAYAGAGKPVLGICRGHQMINVFFGGSLCQHIPEYELHVKRDGRDSAHTVRAVPDSILASLYGTEFSVNSSHHQVIKKLGDGLRATAVWSDKYIEAVEHTSLPIIGVQWHPERMCLSFAREDTVSGLPLLEHFVFLVKEHM